MKRFITISFFLAVGLQLTAQEELTRQQYRVLVQEYSQVLKQAKQKSTAASASEKIAFKGYLPQVDISGDGTLNLNHLDATGGSKPGVYNIGSNGATDLTYLPGTYRGYTYSAQVVVSQPVYVGGALTAKHQMAKADNELAQLSEELTLDQINYQADAVYWNASSAKGMLDAADEFRRIIQKQYDVISERFNDGMISRTDLLMISTRRQEAELQYIQARQNYQLAQQALHILCGRDVNQSSEKLCPIGAICEQVTRVSLDEVLAQRADYQSSMVNIIRTKAGKKAALSQFNPQLSMYVAGGYATQSPHMGADVTLTPILGAKLTIPVFRWGQRAQTSRQQKAYVSIQELQRSYLTDNINQELCGAVTKMDESEKLVSSAQENMKLAQESLDLITFSYNEGKASIVDVLSAQLSWTQANANLINAYLANKMAVAEYRRVVSE